jgi:hypothetical protein
MRGRRPIFTENSSANLTAIRTFPGHEGARAYRSLFDRLFDDIIPILCRFPKSGHVFLTHTVRSADAKTLVKKLGVRLRDREALREFVVDDYLILYLIQHETPCISLDQASPPIIIRLSSILARNLARLSSLTAALLNSFSCGLTPTGGPR